MLSNSAMVSNLDNNGLPPAPAKTDYSPPSTWNRRSTRYVSFRDDTRRRTWSELRYFEEEMSFIAMDETCRLAVLELLHFAELPANAYHRLYVRLSRL